MSSIPSLLELVVSDLLKNSRYTEAFDAASFNLRRDMHAYAKKYYGLGDDVDGTRILANMRFKAKQINILMNKFRKFMSDSLIAPCHNVVENLSRMTDLNLHTYALICAYIDRNYAFLITEFDSIGIFELRDKMDINSYYSDRIEIATRLHYQQYEECTSLIRNDISVFGNNVVDIAIRVEAYEFADVILRDCIKPRDQFEKCREYIECYSRELSALFAGNARKNGEWEKLIEFSSICGR